jgi:hypothetical protein
MVSQSKSVNLLRLINEPNLVSLMLIFSYVYQVLTDITVFTITLTLILGIVWTLVTSTKVLNGYVVKGINKETELITDNINKSLTGFLKLVETLLVKDSETTKMIQELKTALVSIKRRKDEVGNS